MADVQDSSSALLHRRSWPSLPAVEANESARADGVLCEENTQWRHAPSPSLVSGKLRNNGSAWPPKRAASDDELICCREGHNHGRYSQRGSDASPSEATSSSHPAALDQDRGNSGERPPSLRAAAEPRPAFHGSRIPLIPPPESSSILTIYPERTCIKAPNAVTYNSCKQAGLAVMTAAACTENSPTTSSADEWTRSTYAQPSVAPGYQGNVQQFLSIVQQPQSKIVLSGSSVTFSFLVRDSFRRDIHYQWFVGRHQLGGATAHRLVLDDVCAKHEGFYICRAMVVNSNTSISAKGRSYVFSEWAELRLCREVGESPSILTQPSPVVAQYGQSVELRCAAAGVPLPSYQWYHNGCPMAGQTDSVLRIQAAHEGNSGFYSCKAENVFGGVASNIVQVHIHMPVVPELAPQREEGAPIVTDHPQSKQVEHGERAQLSCSVSGAPPLSFQWYKDNVPLSAAASSVLSIERCSDQDSGMYLCLVSNRLGQQWSNPAQLLIKQQPSAPKVEWPSGHGQAHISQAVDSSFSEQEGSSAACQRSAALTLETDARDGGASPPTSPPDHQVTDEEQSSSAAKSSRQGKEEEVHLVQGPGRSPTHETSTQAPSLPPSGHEIDFYASDFAVHPPPRILDHPPPQLSIPLGHQLALSCDAYSFFGQELSFQWQHNSRSLEGETGPQLNLQMAHVGCAGTYVCLVSDKSGQVAYSRPCCVYICGPSWPN